MPLEELYVYRTLVALPLAAVFALAQSPQTTHASAATTAATYAAVPADYTLAPGDSVFIRAIDAEDIDKTTVPVDGRGNIILPMIGKVAATGLTTDQLAVAIEAKLKKYLQDPDVSVTLVEMRSQPVSVLGSVNLPGVKQIQGHKTLYEVISEAGGIRQDAGYEIKITRKLDQGRIPLPTAKDDPTGQFSIATVSIKTVMDATDPAQNIEIKPEDVITVPKGDIVYVVGTVRRSGGFVLTDHNGISLLQALALAEGFDRFADKQHCKILRQLPGSTRRTEIAVDMKALLAGKGEDLQLKPEDVLVVPNSAKKEATVRFLETTLGMGAQIGTGMAIYRN